MDRPNPPTQQLIDELLTFGDLKVWSVLVTIFGDFAPHEGMSLPGPFLSGLTGRLGIRIEAQRVALHRLRKDGWIQVVRRGRVSHYSLSERARQETASVQSRVFDAAIERPDSCFLYVAEPGHSNAPGPEEIAIGPGIWLAATPPESTRDVIASEIPIRGLPHWARDQAMAPRIQMDYQRLLAVLSSTVDPQVICETDRMTLRILVLHRWRRLVLSHPRIAAHIMGAEWGGNTCRARVQDLLSKLKRPETKFENNIKTKC